MLTQRDQMYGVAKWIRQPSSKWNVVFLIYLFKRTKETLHSFPGFPKGLIVEGKKDHFSEGMRSLSQLVLL